MLAEWVASTLSLNYWITCSIMPNSFFSSGSLLVGHWSGEMIILVFNLVCLQRISTSYFPCLNLTPSWVWNSEIQKNSNFWLCKDYNNSYFGTPSLFSLVSVPLLLGLPGALAALCNLGDACGLLGGGFAGAGGSELLFNSCISLAVGFLLFCFDILTQNSTKCPQVNKNPPLFSLNVTEGLWCSIGSKISACCTLYDCNEAIYLHIKMAFAGFKTTTGNYLQR